MKLEVTPVWKIINQNDKPILVLQGSSGSSKTYSILQWLIIKSVSEWQNYTIDIVRRTFPSMRISVIKDFEDILKSLNLYNKDMHNKSENTYKLKSNTFRFYSSDDEQKVRGPRRHIVFFNEVLEMKKMDVLQIMMRTHNLVLMDYNPSEEFHWVYDDILTRDDVNFNKSTYLQNPFLAQNARKEIERLKKTDPNLWRIYGLGERGIAQTTVFKNWDYYEGEIMKQEGQLFFGLDFGYNDPTALVKTKYHKEGVYSKQLLYKTNLTSQMIINELNKLEESGELKKTDKIFADSARPEIIQEIKNAGFNVYPVKKGAGSKLRSINFVKKHKVFIDKESIEFIKELRSYKWKVDKDDKVLDEPVDLNDHLIDSFFYSLNEMSATSGQVYVLDAGDFL